MGKWINDFYQWDIIKIITLVGKEKVQFTLIFYLKQNEELQLDLRFEIFIFSSLLPSFPPGKMREKKLTYIQSYFIFYICECLRNLYIVLKMGYSRWGYGISRGVKEIAYGIPRG